MPAIDLEVSPPDRPIQRWRWIWLVAAATALIFFRLTANLTLSILVACLRFGWNDLQIAAWILRNDPQKTRAALLSLFQITMGMLRVVLAGGAAAFILTVLFCISDNVGLQNLDPIHEVFQTSAIGLAAATSLGLVGLVAAMAARQKIWIERSFIRQIGGAYPPRQFAEWNEMVPVLIAVATVVFLLGGCSAMLIGVEQVPPLDVWVIATATVFGAAVPAGLVALLIDRITAQSPSECWPELHLEHWSTTELHSLPIEEPKRLAAAGEYDWFHPAKTPPH